MDYRSALLSPDTHGGLPLWKAFWIFGVLLSQLLFGLVFYVYLTVGHPMLGVLLLGFLLYTAGIMRLVWVNADNVKDPRWSDIARYLTVAWALNSVLVCGFMFLDKL